MDEQDGVVIKISSFFFELFFFARRTAIKCFSFSILSSFWKWYCKHFLCIQFTKKIDRSFYALLIYHLKNTGFSVSILISICFSGFLKLSFLTDYFISNFLYPLNLRCFPDSFVKILSEIFHSTWYYRLDGDTNETFFHAEVLMSHVNRI